MHATRFASLVSALQWFGFIFANTVVIPLSVGHAFQVPASTMGSLVSHAFIVTGIGCLLQGLFGHGFPIMEGESGIWWGAVLSFASFSTATHTSLKHAGGSLELGMMVTGFLVVVLSLLGFHRLIQKLFRPVVMAVLLFLLSCQLTLLFLKGMTGLDSGQLELKQSVLSFGLALVVMLLTIFGKGLFRNFSVLFGLAAGWVVDRLVLPETQAMSHASLQLAWFPLGAPKVTLAPLLVTILIGLLNATTTVATLQAARPLFQQTTSDSRYKRSYLITGGLTVLSGPLGLVPYAPYTSSIGFLRTTELYDRLPFLLGSGLFAIVGFVPGITDFLSTMPEAVGDAVLFAPYVQLMGSAFGQLESIQFTSRTIFRFGVPILVGLFTYIIPESALSHMPLVLSLLLENGMLIGVFISVLFENTIPWNSLKADASR